MVFRVALLIVSFCVVAALDLALTIEHDVGSGFQKSGHLAATLEGGKLVHNARLKLTWTTTESDLAALRQLASSDALYSMRVTSPESEGVPLQGRTLFSLPASCFLSSLATKHRLDLHASANGKLVGVQWRYPKALECSALAPLGSWPATSDAKAQLPVAGQDLSALQSMAALEASNKPGAQERGLSPPREAAPAKGGPDGAAPVGKDGKPLPEKTFFEKNWMMLAALGFLAINLFFKPPSATPGGGAPDGAPSGGGPVVQGSR